MRIGSMVLDNAMGELHRALPATSEQWNHGTAQGALTNGLRRKLPVAR